MAVQRSGFTITNTASGVPSVSIPIPIEAQVGQLAWVSLTTQQNTVGLISPPAGWNTLVSSLVGSVAVDGVFYKFLTDSDITAGSVTFSSADGSNRIWTGGIATYTGVDTNTPIHVGAVQTTNPTGSTFTTPTLTTTVGGCFVIATFHWSSGTTASTITPTTASLTELWDVQHATAAKRGNELSELQLVGLGNGTLSATVDGGAPYSYHGHAVALLPATAEPLATERLVPNLEVLHVNLPNGTLTDVDEDTTAPDVAWKTASSDPTASTADQTGLTNGPEWVDAHAQASGLVATSWTNAANLVDLSDSTVATFALGANTTDYGTYFSHVAADFSDLPTNAVITKVDVAARMRGQTASRLTAWLQLGTANGTLIGTEVALNGGAAFSTTLADYVASFTTVPTREQLISGTFGARLRMRRSNTVTAEVASIKTTVTYTIPGTAGETRATSYRVGLTSPSRDLEPVAGGSKVRAYVRRRGSGTANPAARLEVLEAGGTTVLATALTDTPITSGTGQYIEGSFNPSVLAAISGANLEIRVASNGADGSLMEVGALDVLAGLSKSTVEKLFSAVMMAGGASMLPTAPLKRVNTASLMQGKGTLAPVTPLKKMNSALVVTGKATVVPLPRLLKHSALSIESRGALTTGPSIRRVGSGVGMAGIGSLSATAIQHRLSAVAMQGTGTVVPSTPLQKRATALLVAGEGKMIPDQSLIRKFSGGILAGKGGLSGIPLVRKGTVVTMAGAGASFWFPSLGDEILHKNSAVAMNGKSGLLAIPLTRKGSAALIAGEGGLFAATIRQNISSVTMSGRGEAIPSATVRRLSALSLQGQGTMVPRGGKNVNSDLGAHGGSTMQSVPQLRKFGHVLFGGTSNMRISQTAPPELKYSFVHIAAGGSMITSPLLRKESYVIIEGDSTLTVDATLLKHSGLSMDGGGNLQLSPLARRFSAARMQGRSDVALVPFVIKGAALSIDGRATLTISTYVPPKNFEATLEVGQSLVTTIEVDPALVTTLVTTGELSWADITVVPTIEATLEVAQ